MTCCHVATGLSATPFVLSARLAVILLAPWEQPWIKTLFKFGLVFLGEFRKFLAGAFFVSAGIQFYLYLAGVSVPLLGNSVVLTPETFSRLFQNVIPFNRLIWYVLYPPVCAVNGRAEIVGGKTTKTSEAQVTVPIISSLSK